MDGRAYTPRPRRRPGRLPAATRSGTPDGGPSRSPGFRCPACATKMTRLTVSSPRSPPVGAAARRLAGALIVRLYPAPAAPGRGHRAGSSELPLDRGEVELSVACPTTTPTRAPRSARSAPRSTGCSGHVGSALDGPAGQRDPGPPVRRRRQPRAAHAAGRDPRLRRADPARTSRCRPVAHAMSRVESEAHADDRAWSRTCCCWPGWTPAGRSPRAGRPVRLVVDAVSDAQAAGPDHRWVLELPDEPVDRRRRRAPGCTRCVANLLANARAHTPAGTTVTVGCRTEDGPRVAARPTTARASRPSCCRGLRAVRPRRLLPIPGGRQHRTRSGHRVGGGGAHHGTVDVVS